MTQHDNTDIAATLTRVMDYIRWGASRFAAAGLAFGHGSDNAVDEAAHLVLDTLGLDATLPDVYLDSTLTFAERDAVIEIIERRIDSRQPAAYITNKAWFAGLEFFVDERVIVPRSPIAELIETEFQPWLGHREPLSVLDLCTGSGAIAIACALAFPEARVVATDASDDALAVARINSDKHDIGPQVEYVKADLFDGLPEQRFDLIVTNPPFHRGVGTEYGTARRIAREAPTKLRRGGTLWMVANHFLPWGEVLEESFAEVERVHAGRRFKVWRATGARG
mgnify:CR=1 FL=1